MSPTINGELLIKRERERQIAKGYTAEHADAHVLFDVFDRAGEAFEHNEVAYWPWDRALFHPRGALWNLTRAGAMYLAGQQVAERKGIPGWVARYSESRARIEAAIDRLLWEVEDARSALAPADERESPAKSPYDIAEEALRRCERDFGIISFQDAATYVVDDLKMASARTAVVDIEQACEVMHDAYERAALAEGWETQERSRVAWADVPEENKRTMRVAVMAVLAMFGKEPV